MYNVYIMTSFKAQEFKIPKLKGISAKTIEEHLKLYQGYVTHSNLVLEKITELSEKAEENMGLISGLQRRFGFEFNGMRNHEIYFTQFEGGHELCVGGDPIHQAISKEWEDFNKWLGFFKTIATTRGIGWAILYYDPLSERLLNAWIDEQHLGQLSGCTPILALDMWEHSYVADYQPSGKKDYVNDFFENLNWEIIEKNFELAIEK